jgi:hypothetical protein
MRDITTPEQATATMRAALDQHGMPLALCHVPIRVRNLVPNLTLRLLLDSYRNQQPTVVTGDEVNSTLTAWCDAHPYHTVTTRELSEVGGCTQHRARKFIADNPHYFKRLNQYKHEVRNYREDRAHDKALTA